MRFNPSLISQWMTCPLQIKYDLEYDLPEQINAKTQYGSIIHEALYYYNIHGNIDNAIALFLYEWEHAPEPDWWPTGSTYHGLRQKGVETLKTYHEKHQWESRQIVAAEHRFCVPFGDHELSGIADLVEIRKNSKGKPALCIIDYKSASRKPTIKELNFNIQFTAYAYAAAQPEFWFGNHPEEVDDDGNQKYRPIDNADDLWDYAQKLPIDSFWYHLNDNKEIAAGKRDDGDFARLYKCMEEIANAIDKEVFVPNIKAETCQWCPYAQDICTVVTPVYDRLAIKKEIIF